MHLVVNLDALTYAASLDSLALVAGSNHYSFEQADIRDREALDHVFATHAPDVVMDPAAENHVDRSIDAGGISSRPTSPAPTWWRWTRAYWTSQGKPEGYPPLHISTDEVKEPWDLRGCSMRTLLTTRAAPFGVEGGKRPSGAGVA